MFCTTNSRHHERRRANLDAHDVLRVVCFLVGVSLTERFCSVAVIEGVLGNALFYWVGHEGLEPSANGLRVHCSTN